MLCYFPKMLKKLFTAAAAFCLLSYSAMAEEPNTTLKRLPNDSEVAQCHTGKSGEAYFVGVEEGNIPQKCKIIFCSKGETWLVDRETAEILKEAFNIPAPTEEIIARTPEQDKELCPRLFK